MENDFIQVDGSNFILNDKNVILRGFGFGNWLNIEHFMIGLPGTESQLKLAIKKAYGFKKAREFWEKYYSCYIQEEDFKFLKSIGVNSVRLSFNHHHFESDENPYQFNSDGFEKIDRILPYCEKYGIYAILDLHTAPGGQNPDWHSDNSTGEALFWEYKEFQNKVIELWKYIAKKYCSNIWIAGYDFLNEPCYFKPYSKAVDQFYHELAKEIRKIDKNHIFFIEGDFYAHYFKKYQPYQDPNIAYSFHFYPSMFSDNKELIKNPKNLKPILKKMILNDGEIFYVLEKLKRPLWCGETGISHKAENKQFSVLLLKNALDIFEELGISWSVWTYKDAGSMGCVYPKETSKWMKFSRRCSGDWKFEEEFKKYLVFNEVLKEMNLTNLSNDLQRKLNFRLMANDQYVLISRYEELLKDELFEELITYPDSFTFKNCNIWEEISNLITTYTKD